MAVSPTLVRLVSAAHSFWYRLTGGRVGGKVSGAPVLLLTTTGRKSGKRRTTPLLYLRDGETIVIVASNGGRDVHPAWWLNLQTNPEADVQLGKARSPLIASKASAEERARLWPLLVEMYPGYGDYQKRTKRQIPVVILRRGAQ